MLAPVVARRVPPVMTVRECWLGESQVSSCNILSRFRILGHLGAAAVVWLSAWSWCDSCRRWRCPGWCGWRLLARGCRLSVVLEVGVGMRALSVRIGDRLRRPATTTSCCSGGDVIQLGRCCPNPMGGVGDVRCYGQKSWPSSVGAGVDGARGCRFPPWRRHRGVSASPPRIGVWLLSPGESIGSVPNRRWRRSRRRSFVGSIVCGDTAWRCCVVILRCLLMSQVEIQGRYVRHRWCIHDDALLKTDQVPPSTRHPLLGNHGWMVR